MNWLNIWVNTFTKRIKRKYTFMDGVKSVVFASIIVGALTFSVSLMETDDAASSFVTNIIIMPILFLACLMSFVGVFRWVAGMNKGKGKFQKDFAVAGVYMGSLIFAMGVIGLVFGILMIMMFPSTTVEAADADFFSTFLILGAMAAIMVYLTAIVIGIWLEELATAEKLSVSATAKVFGLACAIIIMVVMVVLGGLLELLLGSYNAAAQYGASSIGV